MLKWIIIINSFLPWILLLILIIIKDLVSKLDFKINYIIYSKKKNDIEKFKQSIDKITDEEIDLETKGEISEEELSKIKSVESLEELESIKSSLELGEKVYHTGSGSDVMIFQYQLTCLSKQELVYLGLYKVTK